MIGDTPKFGEVEPGYIPPKFGSLGEPDEPIIENEPEWTKNVVAVADRPQMFPVANRDVLDRTKEYLADKKFCDIGEDELLKNTPVGGSEKALN